MCGCVDSGCVCSTVLKKKNVKSYVIMLICYHKPLTLSLEAISKPVLTIWQNKTQHVCRVSVSCIWNMLNDDVVQTLKISAVFFPTGKIGQEPLLTRCFFETLCPLKNCIISVDIYMTAKLCRNHTYIRWNHQTNMGHTASWRCRDAEVFWARQDQIPQ